MDIGRGGARRCSRVLVVDRERERAEKGKEVRRERRGSRGPRASHWCGWKRRDVALEQEVASLAARVQARSCFSSWQEEEDDVAPVGWARIGTGRPEAPGKKPR